MRRIFLIFGAFWKSDSVKGRKVLNLSYGTQSVVSPINMFTGGVVPIIVVWVSAFSQNILQNNWDLTKYKKNHLLFFRKWNYKIKISFLVPKLSTQNLYKTASVLIILITKLSLVKYNKLHNFYPNNPSIYGQNKIRPLIDFKNHTHLNEMPCNLRTGTPLYRKMYLKNQETKR